MRALQLRLLPLAGAACLAACDGVTSPLALADGRESDRCVNVAHTGEADYVVTVSK